MKTKFRIPILVGLCLLSVGSCGPDEPVTPPDRGRITQVSVIDALMIGRYDGVMPIPELLRHGDFGVGTLDHLDGEMIILDGRAYQVRGIDSISSLSRRFIFNPASPARSSPQSRRPRRAPGGGRASAPSSCRRGRCS